jgi:type IV pilus assembly protein PilO
MDPVPRPQPSKPTRRIRLWRILEARLGKTRPQFYWAIAYAIGLALAASLSISAVLGQAAAIQEAGTSRIKLEIPRLDDEIRQVAALKADSEVLEARRVVVEQLRNTRNEAAFVLAALAKAVPDETLAKLVATSPVSSKSLHADRENVRSIHLTEIQVNGNSLVLRGETYSTEKVSALMRNLAGFRDAALYFGQIRLAQLELANADAGSAPAELELKKFVLEMKILRSSDGKAEARPVAAAAAESRPKPPETAPEDGQGSSFGLLVAAALAVMAGGAIFLLWRFFRGRNGNRRTVDGSGQECSWSAFLRSVREVDHANLDTWPPAVRLFVLVELFAATFGILFVVLVVPAIDKLESNAEIEMKLKEEFHAKVQAAVGLDAYRKRHARIREHAVDLEKQMPTRFEEAAVLSDLNMAALGRGLTVQQMNPVGAGAARNYYAAQPWSVRLAGDFDGMGAFVSDIGELARIVTLPSYRISVAQQASKREPGLLLEAALETYRYLDADEVEAQRAAERAAKNAKNKGKK